MDQTIILLAISFPMATLDSLTFTIRLPLISETTVTTPPTTKPSSSRCLFTSSLPPILLIVKGSPAFTMVIAVMAGYALSRYYKQKLVKVSNFAMMLSQMIPGVLLLVPLYMIMQKFHILETYLCLILAYTTFVIPLCTFMMSSFFDTVPMALEEAAEIDGCGKAQTIFKIILPLSVPSLISTGLYAFINAWNEFMFGYIFISTDKYRTLTPAIMLFKGANTIDWGGLMAGSVIAVIPVTIIFLFLQKYFLAGLMSGSVKG